MTKTKRLMWLLNAILFAIPFLATCYVGSGLAKAGVELTISHPLVLVWIASLLGVKWCLYMATLQK